MIRDADMIRVAYGGIARVIDPNDALECEAYSRFCIKEIFVGEDKVIDLEVAAAPVKKEIKDERND